MSSIRSVQTWGLLVPLCAAVICGAQAGVITQNLDFVAANQNPFAAGPAYTAVYEQAIPLPTQRTDFPAIIIPLSPASYPRVELGGSVTGEMNLDFWASLNTGRLNINYPVQAALNVPDSLTVGQTFSLGSGANVLPAGYSQLILVPAGSFSGSPGASNYLTTAQISSGAPSLTTSNPGIAAGVDFNITNHNFLYAQGCATPLSITCAYIVKEDLPSLGSKTITLVSASTAGSVQILPDVGGGTYSLPQTIPLGTFASFTVDKPDLRQNGTLVGSSLQADKTSNVATLTLDIDALLSNAVLNPLLLPPLTGDIGPIGYSLLDASASLSGGLYQSLDFNVTHTKVTLVFDHSVRARVNGVDHGIVNALEFNAGDDVKLSPVGFVTTLHVVPSFTLDNNLHNSTGIALTGSLDAKALEASLGSLGSTGFLASGHVDVPLGQLELYHNDFSVDIKRVWGNAFDIHFGLNPRAVGVSVDLTELTEGSDGSATFHFRLIRDGSVLDEFDVAGRVQRFLPCPSCDIGTAFFLPDTEVFGTIDGESVDLGDAFCWSGLCLDGFDLSSLDGLVHAATAVGFDPVLFADESQDFFVSDPLLTDEFVSHGASVPDPGFVYEYNPEFYEELLSATAPEPTTLSILGLGLAGLGVMRRRRAALSRATRRTTGRGRPSRPLRHGRNRNAGRAGAAGPTRTPAGVTLDATVLKRRSLIQKIADFRKVRDTGARAVGEAHRHTFCADGAAGFGAARPAGQDAQGRRRRNRDQPGARRVQARHQPLIQPAGGRDRQRRRQGSGCRPRHGNVDERLVVHERRGRRQRQR